LWPPAPAPCLVHAVLRNRRLLGKHAHGDACTPNVCIPRRLRRHGRSAHTAQRADGRGYPILRTLSCTLSCAQVKLKHVETGVYLASSERKYGRPISGQQEVCGRKKADWWAATEGVYFTERPADA